MPGTHDRNIDFTKLSPHDQRKKELELNIMNTVFMVLDPKCQTSFDFSLFMGHLRERIERNSNPRINYVLDNETGTNKEKDAKLFKHILEVIPHKPLNKEKQTIFHLVPLISQKSDHAIVADSLPQALKMADLLQWSNKPPILSAKDTQGNTPLHCIAMYGSRAALLTERYFNYAKECNIDINTQNNQGITPLHFCCKNHAQASSIAVRDVNDHNSIESNAALNHILSNFADKVDLNAVNSNCRTPPMLEALKNKNFEAVERLLDAEADPEFKYDQNEESPLEYIQKTLITPDVKDQYINKLKTLEEKALNSTLIKNKRRYENIIDKLINNLNSYKETLNDESVNATFTNFFKSNVSIIKGQKQDTADKIITDLSTLKDNLSVYMDSEYGGLDQQDKETVEAGINPRLKNKHLKDIGAQLASIKQETVPSHFQKALTDFARAYQDVPGIKNNSKFKELFNLDNSNEHQAQASPS